MTITVIPVKLDKDIEAGDNIGSLIAESAGDIRTGDILVVAQKIVSKSEGQLVYLKDVKPSPKAKSLAGKLGKDPRLVELILSESVSVVRARNGVIITETKHGFVCANSGVDQSNLAHDDAAVLLPKDPDRSARILQRNIKQKTGASVAVLITDTFGRPFRNGQANIAIGSASIKPIKSYIGKKDMFGRKLQVTEIAIADEIASAAELVMGKSAGIPAAIIRGYEFVKSGTAKDLIRPKKQDLFR